MKISEVKKAILKARAILEKTNGNSELLDLTKPIFEAWEKLADELLKSGHKKISYQGETMVFSVGKKLTKKEEALLRELNTAIQSALQALAA